MAAGAARHSRVIVNLARHIGDHLDDTPCQVFAESMKVQITDGMRYPDVMVTCGNAEAGDEQTVIDPSSSSRFYLPAPEVMTSETSSFSTAP